MPNRIQHFSPLKTWIILHIHAWLGLSPTREATCGGGRVSCPGSPCAALGNVACDFLLSGVFFSCRVPVEWMRYWSFLLFPVGCGKEMVATVQEASFCGRNMESYRTLYIGNMEIMGLCE
ncbi:hypothetical protein JTE90_005847 [Oedothorax gibbosus]|uniref:Uncharacterized protein n=1 Tax=Oedothorax gibbosus TaxID=931172 RepID=A0AAV6V524_9ARAC|nr:hypothetical protein JTE90_005847 [Oedothorax gibbosus]